MAFRRFQVEIEEAEEGELEMLMKSCEITTKKDLFNNALTLFRWAVLNVKKGAEIAAINEGKKTYQVVNMPALDAVSKKDAI